MQFTKILNGKIEVSEWLEMALQGLDIGTSSIKVLVAEVY